MSLVAASAAGTEACGVNEESDETDRQHSVHVKNKPDEFCHHVPVKQEPKEEIDGDQHSIHIKEADRQHSIHVKKEPQWTGHQTSDLKSDVKQDGLPEFYAGIKVEIKLEPVSEESQSLEYSFVRPTSPTLAVGSRAKHEEAVSPESSAGSGEWSSHQPCSQTKQSMVNSPITEHLELHSKDTPPANNPYKLETNLVKGERDSIEKKITCDVCMKQFQRKSDLVKHSQAHSGVRPYSCVMCTKQFTRNGDLLKHRRTHTGEKPYTCKLCPKQFTRNGDLVIHSRTHTGEKPYSCKMCPKQFTRKSILVQHTLTHTGEKPYTCKVCSRQFTQKSNLIVHRRIHTGEKPYSCDVCMKQFAHKNGLAVHRQIHNKGLPYICDICSKQFTEKSDLVTHLRTHTEEKGCP